MKKLLFAAFLFTISFAFSGFAQLSGSSTVKNDAHLTYTIADTVTTTELATWSKVFGENQRYDNTTINVDIDRIGATTIDGTITIKVKTTANSIRYATIKSGTYTHTVGNNPTASVSFNIPFAIYAFQVEVQGAGAGSYKIWVTEKHQRTGN